jgi:uncharacterized protein (DUF433 family)
MPRISKAEQHSRTIAKMRDDGKTVQEIADHFDMTYRAMNKWMIKNKMRRPPIPHIQTLNDNLSDVANMRAMGVSNKDIAAKYGVTTDQVRQYCQARKIRAIVPTDTPRGRPTFKGLSADDFAALDDMAKS